MAEYERVRSVSARVACAAALLVGIAAAAAPVAAQQTGTVTGTVVSAQTGEPLANVQVTLVGLLRESTTDARGQYLLLNVPAGERQVQAQSLGFRAATQTVRVDAGQTVRLEIRMTVAAIALDEVVVTGQALGTARREIGTSVASINVADLQTAPVSNVAQLLQSRAPGVTILPSGGNVGQGSRIVLRGPVSMSQSIEPLIYVDGARLDNMKYMGTMGAGGNSWMGLDDIRPEDIERIEIVRGAAAATLYGTEAAAGVIQIFTKQGRGAGPQRWEVRSEWGVLETPRDWWDVSIYSNWYYDNYVKRGSQSSNHLSVRGSMEGFSYMLSGGLARNDGVLRQNFDNTTSFRANMEFTPTERLRVDVRTGYYRRFHQHPETGNNSNSLNYNGLAGGPRGVGNLRTERLDAREMHARSGRFTSSVNAYWAPVRDLTHRVTFAFETVNQDNVSKLGHGEPLNPGGYTYNTRMANDAWNFDYTGAYRRQLSTRFRSNTQWGFQYYSGARSYVDAWGWGISPGFETVSSARLSQGWETRSWTKTAGFFGEQQIGLNDYLFLTVGTRFDGSSSFGSDAGYTMYPKVDGSWVVSSMSWWPEQLGTLRLRGAYGTAGRQPNQYTAERTWVPFTALEGLPAVTSGNLGNPDLRPEVSREIEFGFEAGLLNERLGVEYTSSWQRTTDGLYPTIQPASSGFLSSQITNVGELRNRTHELAVRAAVLDNRSLLWNVRGSMTSTRSEITDLGGANPLQVGTVQWMRQGYPVAALFSDRYIMVDGKAVLASEHYTLRDADGNPIRDKLGAIQRQEGWDYIGPAFPTLQFVLSSDVSVRRNLRVNVLFDHKSGHFLSSSTSQLLHSAASSARVQPGEELYDENDPATSRFAPGSPKGNQCIQPKDAIWQAMCAQVVPPNSGWHVFSADSWRLREVSMAYTLPRKLVTRWHASSATVSVAVRNLLRRQEYPGTEAEAYFSTASSFSQQTMFDTPLPRMITAAISFSF